MEGAATVCAGCGDGVNSGLQALADPIDEPMPTAAPAETTAAPGAARPMFAMANDLEGIGGWLILVAIGLAISPFRSLHGIFLDVRLLDGVRYQAALAARPGLAVLVLFEAISNSIFLTGLLVLNFLFYRKKKVFPGWMITFLVFQMAVVLIDHFGAARYSSSNQLLPMMTALLTAAIWIPYYLVSERVKQTFVN